MAHYYRIFACFIFSFFSITAHADWASDREAKIKQNRIDYAQKVYGMSNLEATAKVTAGMSEGKVKQTATFSGTSSDGSKITASASVTKTVDKAKVASTLTDRLKKAKDYASKTGKASIPAFVGMAAFNGLMEGIDWVMDEGGKVHKKDDSVNVSDRFQSKYKDQDIYARSEGQLCVVYAENWKTDNSPQNEYPAMSYKSHSVNGSQLLCSYYYYPGAYTTNASIPIEINPNYQQPQPQTEVSNDELKQALQGALDSNNPALAAAITEAIKSAYSPDNTAGQDSASNTLAASSNDDIKNAITAAANNTGSESTSDGKPGHYKITDGDKTIEGYVTPADTSAQTSTDSESTTVIDPETGNQVTTGTATGSFQLPAFCDWASIVCDWINWTKEEPDEPEELKPVFEEIEVPFVPFSIANFNAQCPPDEQLSLTLMGQETSFVFPMTPFCDFFTAIKPFVIALASFWAVKLIGGGAFNWGN